MRTCLYCGKSANLCCDQNTEVASCQDCVQVIRATVGGMRYASFSPCPEKPGERREKEYQAEQRQKIQAAIQWSVIQIEREQEEMKANSSIQAQKEGKLFALQFRALLTGTKDFEVVSDFAQYLAVNVLGYTSAELANPWTKGFISGWMEEPKTQPDMASAGDLAMINQLRSWLGMPPLEASSPGLLANQESDV